MAERFANGAQEIDPQDAKGYLLLAIIEANRGEFDKANATIEKAILLNPGSNALREMQKNIRSHTVPPLSGCSHMASGI
jgi:Flp pilus assembly protein TadD